MSKKPTYEELEQRVRELETECLERNRMELSLQRSEERFRAIFETAQDAIFLKDRSLRYTHVNPATEKLFRLSAQELIGKNDEELFGEEAGSHVRESESRVLSGEITQEALTRPVGKIRNTFHVVKVPIRDNAGEITGLCGIARNITERMLVEEELIKHREHLRSLLESASGFAVYRLAFDENDPYMLRNIFVSPSIKEILGIDPENWSSKTFFENIHPEEIERVEEANRKAFETNRFDEVCRFYNSQKNEWIWIHTISTGVRDDEGKVTHVNGIIIDVTSQQRAEGALKQACYRLENKTVKFKELNSALNVLLEKGAEDKIALEEQVLSNVKKLIMPYLKKLNKSKMDSQQEALVNILESNLNEIVSPFSLKLSSVRFGLTRREIRVADLVKQGKRTKEIARFLNISSKTIEHHRRNIRKKLGLNNSAFNLQSYLLSLR